MVAVASVHLTQGKNRDDSGPAIRVGRQLDGVDALVGAHRSLVELLALNRSSQSSRFKGGVASRMQRTLRDIPIGKQVARPYNRRPGPILNRDGAEYLPWECGSTGLTKAHGSAVAS